MIYRGFLFFLLFIIVSCAQQGIPTGGPQDKEPPKISWTEPSMYQKKVQEDIVRIHFDEFVELNQPNENILISPSPASTPKFTINGKTVAIHFQEPLKQNTTYYIQTNQAFKDYSEGNLSENTSLLFSTGSIIDTSNFTVKCNSAYGPVSNWARIVMTKDTASFFQGRYEFIANQKNNIAKFPNLNNDLFNVFAFVDSNKNNKWDINEWVGFLNNKINKNDTSNTINLFLDESQVNSAKLISQNSQLYKLMFKKAPINLQCISPCEDVVRFQLSSNEIYFLYKDKVIQDSFEYKIGDLTYKAAFNPSKIEEPVKRIKTILEGRIEELKDPKNVEIYFNYIIQNIDSQLIKVKLDSVDSVNYTLSFLNNKIIIKGLDYGKKYQVFINKKAILTNKGFNLNVDTVFFNTFPTTAIHDSLEITFTPPITKNTRVYLDNPNGYMPLVIENNTSLLNNITKENLNFIIFEDLNNNKTWDSGILRSLKQPEPLYIKSQPLTTEKKYQITWK